MESESHIETPAWFGDTRVRRFATCGWVAIILFAAFASYRVQHTSDPVARRYRDFFEFYSAAEALVTGRDVFAAGNLGYVYPPLLATALMPLVKLGLPGAGMVWLMFNAVLFGGAAWLGGRVVTGMLGLPRAAPMTTFFGVLLLADKVVGEMKMQQSNVLMLACWVVGMWGVVPGVKGWRGPVIAGIALGLGANIKYVTLAALPYFAVRGRWKHGAALIASAILLGLAPAAVLGWEGNISLWRGAVQGLASAVEPSSPDAAAIEGRAKVMSVRDYGISISTAFVRLGDRLGSPTLGPTLSAVALLAVFGAAWIIYARCGRPMWRARFGASEAMRPRLVMVEWVGLIVVVLAFSPQTNSRHLVQALPLALMLAGAGVCARERRTRMFAATGALVWWLGMVLPIPITAEQEWVWSWRRAGGACTCMVAAWLLGTAAMLREAPRATP